MRYPEKRLNKAETYAAQDKQRAIITAFDQWIHADEARKNAVSEYYNNTFSGYVFRPYDGSFLQLPDLNPEIKLYPHQRNAVARIVLSNSNVLLAHDVGTGKTYEMIVGVHELKRMGLSTKNLIVVPNNVLQPTVESHRLLYPNDKILTVYPSDFIPKYRKQILEKIRDEDFTAIYMAYSSFDIISMSKDYYVAKMQKELSQLRNAAANAKHKREKQALIAEGNRLEKKLSEFVLKPEDSSQIPFEELGITTLAVDEAHNYKNIPINSRAENIVGMHNKGSKKSAEMLEKCHNVDRIIFATGTPLTNSLTDLFVLQSYLQPKELEFHEITSFDMWINTFGERETNWELDVDSNHLRAVTRFSSFHNLTELMSLFTTVCDFHHSSRDENGLPHFNGYTDICVPRSEAQTEYIKTLSKRCEDIRERKVKRKEDNLLLVTTDGRKAALDMRLIDPQMVIREKTKIDFCAENILKLYAEYPGTCQLVFSDIGTPKKTTFNVYDALKERLISLGIKEHEVAFIHDATTEKARASLFSKMNTGLIRVVIGSTAKLGEGVNVQERLVALHHLSVPWRPADMVQREGRILRRGNKCPEVFIFRYITEGSFDSYSWQILENKQRFISAFLSGTAATRDIDDIADSVLSYAEVKALAIGNPLIKKRVETANELERVKISARARQKQLNSLRTVIENTPGKLAGLQDTIGKINADISIYRSSKEKVSNDERIAFGEELIASLRDNAMKPNQRTFDEYQGFKVVLPANMVDTKPYVFICSENMNYYLEMDTDKPLGCSKAIDYLLDHLPERVENLAEQMTLCVKQRDDAVLDLENGNPYHETLEQLEDTLAEIDFELQEAA